MLITLLVLPALSTPLSGFFADVLDNPSYQTELPLESSGVAQDRLGDSSGTGGGSGSGSGGSGSGSGGSGSGSGGSGSGSGGSGSGSGGSAGSGSISISTGDGSGTGDSSGSSSTSTGDGSSTGGGGGSSGRSDGPEPLHAPSDTTPPVLPEDTDTPAEVLPPVAAEPPAIQAVLWVLLGVLGVILLAGIVRAVSARLQRSPAVENVSPDTETVAPDIPEPRAPPEVLAKELHYGEAVHAMLLLALRDLARRGGILAQHSMTSREILRHAELPPEATAQLSVLVSAVELWWFGGRELSRAEYDRCAAAWDALRPALMTS